MGKIRPSMAFDAMVGSSRGVTVVRGRTGLVTQSPKTYRRHISPAQAASMSRMATAGLAWEGLSEASVAEWRRYADRIVRTGDVSGEKYHPLAFNVFSGLFCKLLQIDPAAAVPEWPPQGPMPIDRIGVTVATGSPSFQSGERKGLGDGESGSAALSPLPPSLASERGGVLIYTASGANAPGMLTEILYQKLPGRHRLPKPKSKSAGFVAFTDSNLTFALPVEPGTYFCAFGVVEASTGRAGRVMPIGTVTVGV